MAWESGAARRGPRLRRSWLKSEEVKERSLTAVSTYPRSCLVGYKNGAASQLLSFAFVPRGTILADGPLQPKVCFPRALSTPRSISQAHSDGFRGQFDAFSTHSVIPFNDLNTLSTRFSSIFNAILARFKRTLSAFSWHFREI